MVDRMKTLGLLVSAVLVVALALSAFSINGLFLPSSTGATASTAADSFIKYAGYVTVAVNGKVISQNKHNFFSNAGKDMVLDLLGGRVAPGPAGVLSNATQILIGNDSGNVGLIGPYNDSGLANTTGTVARITNGNWSVVATFTSTANNKDVNATALYNGSAGGATYFAGNNFTKVTLQNGDQITVTWNISVS